MVEFNEQGLMRFLAAVEDIAASLNSIDEKLAELLPKRDENGNVTRPTRSGIWGGN